MQMVVVSVDMAPQTGHCLPAVYLQKVLNVSHVSFVPYVPNLMCIFFMSCRPTRKLFWTYEGVNETWNDGPNIKGLKYFHKSHSNFLFSSFKSLWQTFLLWRKATACAICFIQKSNIWIPALLKSHKCIPGVQFLAVQDSSISDIVCLSVPWSLGAN